MFPIKQVRLWPRGSKKHPTFTIVICFKKTRHRGAFLERLGHFNPQLKNREFSINSFRLAFWLNRGASVHPSVYKILSQRALFDLPF